MKGSYCFLDAGIDVGLPYSGSAPDIGAYEYIGPIQTCSGLGGLCCTAGQECQGGSFQSSSDCGSLCCVGGTCQTPSPTCQNQGFNCCDSCDPGTEQSIYDGDCPRQVCCGSCSIDIDTGLVGYWQFEEGSGTTATDSSGNGNDGTIYGATYTTGKFGNALSFDGNGDYVVAENVFSGSNPFTASVWVKPDSCSVSGSFLARMGASQQYAWVLKFDTTNSALRYYHVGLWEESHYNFACKVGEWIHAAIAWDGDYTYLYYNGTQVDSDNINSALSDLPNLFIGNEVDLSYFNCTIDEIKIYNRALSSAEILELYEVATCSQADTSEDGVIDIQELMSYITEWKNGNVGIVELMTAIGKWKSGCS